MPSENASQTEQSADVASQSANSTQKKEKVAEAIRKFKLKVNGKQLEMDQKSVTAYAQKGMAADERFQKAAAREKQIDALLRKAKEDPDSFIKEILGQDSLEYSKKRLSKELQELSLDPKEKELREYKRKVQAYEAEKAKAQQAEKKAQADKAVEHWTKHYDKVLPQSLKAVGLPLTQDVIRHATDIMIANLEDGIDLPMEVIMELTKERYLESVKGFLGASDKDKLTELLGQDIVEKLGIVRPSKKTASKQSLPSSESKTSVKSQKQAMRQLERQLKEWQQQG